MEQAILTLVSLGVMLTLYLDRARRSETRKLRADTNDGLGALRKEMNDLRKEMTKAIKSSASTISARVDNLNTSVIDLANKVGRVEGRTEILAAVE